MFALTLPPRFESASCSGVCLGNSYPPLASVSSFERYAALKALKQTDAPLIISLQLCQALSKASPEQQQQWLNSLQQEARLLLPHVPERTKVLAFRVQGHTQGLAPDLLAQLPQVLQHLVQAKPPRDLAIELRASTADWGLLCQLREAGYNQLLLNSTQLNDAASCQHSQRLLEGARTLEYKQVGLSLCSSASLTPEGNEALQGLLSLQPDHILLPNSVPQPQLAKLLAQQGYQALGLHSYVLPDDEALDLQSSLDNQSLAQPWLLGLGCGAYSQLGSLSYYNHPEQNRCLQATSKGQLPPAKGTRYNRLDLLRHNMRQQLEWLGHAKLSCLAAGLQLNSKQLVSQLLPWLNRQVVSLDNGFLRIQQTNPQQLELLLNALLSNSACTGSFDKAQVT